MYRLFSVRGEIGFVRGLTDAKTVARVNYIDKDITIEGAGVKYVFNGERFKKLTKSGETTLLEVIK